MLKIIFSFVLISLSFTALAQADITPLKLQCFISFDHYSSVDKATKTAKAILNNSKHKSGGSKLVTQTDSFEFWVMTHTIQKINKLSFISNFQVAIKDKKSGLFAHALSDSSHNSEKPLLKARISLVDYAPNSFMEKGELFFECSSL